MPEGKYDVVVVRINEGEYESDKLKMKADAVSVDVEGRINIETSTGSKSIAATTWGALSAHEPLPSGERPKKQT